MEGSTTNGEMGAANMALDVLTPATAVTNAIASSALTSVNPPPASASSSGSASSSSGGGVLSWLFGGLTGVTDFLPNAGLVMLGVVLGVGALMVSQKQTIVQVASKAGALAA